MGMTSEVYRWRLLNLDAFRSGARLSYTVTLVFNALSVLVPVLEEVVGWDAAQIRQLFASHGLVLQEWDKARTDWVTVRAYPEVGAGCGPVSAGLDGSLCVPGCS